MATARSDDPTDAASWPTEAEVQQIILESVADGVFTVDARWRITSFNRAAERITGVARRDAIGRPCREVLRASMCEDRCALRHTMQTQQPVVAKRVLIVNAQGERVPISVSTAVLRNSDGTVLGAVETFRDLSLVEQLRKQLRHEYSFADIVGRSAAMRRLFDVLPQIADSNATVLIEGASGTGKELFARAVHSCSPRRRGPFVAINCGALPDALLESELFGYKAGAFTDARGDKPGRFSRAEGGTIFLDELNDVSPAMQAKLLRVLQQREYEPLGAVTPTPTDVRVIAATNRNLEQLVADGSFREDLYYRVNVVRMELPRLAQRREDIPLLVEHFLAKFNRLQDKNIVELSSEAMACLMRYDYPGNVRQLENFVEHATVLCRGAQIELEHLPMVVRADAPGDCTSVHGSLQSLEKAHLVAALERWGGNRTAAARELGIHPSTLFRKVKSLGIALPHRDGRHRRD